jgi:hypothetical protein
VLTLKNKGHNTESPFIRHYKPDKETKKNKTGRFTETSTKQPAKQALPHNNIKCLTYWASVM